jgi:hypothetical protein
MNVLLSSLDFHAGTAYSGYCGQRTGALRERLGLFGIPRYGHRQIDLMKTLCNSSFRGARSSLPPFLASGQKQTLTTQQQIARGAQAPSRAVVVAPPTTPQFRLILCCVLTVVMAFSASAQIQPAWVARYNNGITNGTHQAVKMALDPAGNMYITGFSQNTNGNLGYVTMKYAPNGSQVWASRYDSSSYPSATPSAMALDISNDVIVTGNALTIKYDSNGVLQWTAPYAGTALAVDSNANVYVAGFSQNFGCVKLSPQGSNVWLTTFVESYGPTISQAVLVDSGNNVYVSGLDTYNYGPTSSGNEPYVQLTTIKYGSNANQLWKAAQMICPICIVSSVQIEGSALDSANNLYLVVHWSTDIPGLFGVYKYTLDGSLAWRTYPDADGYSKSFGLVLDGNTNVLVTGKLGDEYPEFYYGTFKISTNGSVLWGSYYPLPPVGVSVATSIAVDSANNSYVTGCSPGTNANNDIVTIKYASNGNQVWLQRYSSVGNGNAAGNAIAVDHQGNVYVTGYDTTTAGGTEIVTIKYSPLTVQRRSDGTVMLQAQGSPGESFDVQASTNLQTWLDLGNVTADTNGLMQFNDTNAPQYNDRFYTTSPQ